MTDATATTSTNSQEQGTGISTDLLAILVCPIDHAPLTTEGQNLVCTKCARRYPVQNGIPNMVVE